MCYSEETSTVWRLIATRNSQHKGKLIRPQCNNYLVLLYILRSSNENRTNLWGKRDTAVQQAHLYTCVNKCVATDTNVYVWWHSSQRAYELLLWLYRSLPLFHFDGGCEWVFCVPRFILIIIVTLFVLECRLVSAYHFKVLGGGVSYLRVQRLVASHIYPSRMCVQLWRESICISKNHIFHRWNDHSIDGWCCGWRMDDQLPSVLAPS